MKKSLFAGFLLVATVFLPTLSLAQTIGDVDTSPQTSSCVDLQNNLRYRSTDKATNGEVSLLQSFLQDKGYLTSDPTGFFGKLTVDAVVKFQSANGVPLSSPAGFVGSLTRAKIQALTCTVGSTTQPLTETASPLAPAVAGTAPTATITRTPSLKLSYDSARKESALTATYSVNVTAGNRSALVLNKPGYYAGADSSSLYVQLSNKNFGYTSQVAPGRLLVTTNNSGIVDSGSYWTIPTSKTASFVVTDTFDPKQLFAGTYSAKLSLYNNTTGNIPTSGTSQTNGVTVVGEVSPYIISATTDSNGLVTLIGIRFAPSSNTITLGGLTLGNDFASSNGGTMITFVPAKFGITPGTYSVQVTSPTTGTSNNAPVTTAGTTNSTLVVEFLGTPTLSIVYSPLTGGEGNLVGTAVMKITTGNSPISGAGIAQILQFYKGAGAIYSNGLRFNMTSSSGLDKSIPANTSATFTITNTIPASELFAGTYTLGLTGLSYVDANGAYQNLQSTSFAGVTTDGGVIKGVNPITIVGEVSPYISSVTSDASGNITVNGVRLDLTGNSAVIDGSKVVTASKGDATFMFFGSAPYGLANGSHYLQVINSQVGDSNRVYFTLNTTVTPTACKVVDVYATQVPGYVYYDFFIKVQGMPSALAASSFGITGADSWNSLIFNNYSPELGTLKATQTVNDVGISYILARKNNIAVTQNGAVVCTSMASTTSCPIPGTVPLCSNGTQVPYDSVTCQWKWDACPMHVAPVQLKTKPTISQIALPTAQLTLGVGNLAKFRISADAGGDLAWRKLLVNVTTSAGVTTSGWTIYDETNMPLPDTTSSVVGGTVVFTSASDQIILAANSKTYSVKATIGGSTSGQFISTSIASGQTAAVAPNTYAATAALSPAPTFIWSDKSGAGHSATTSDWVGDYGVTGIPTAQQSLLAQSNSIQLQNLASVLVSLLDILKGF